MTNAAAELPPDFRTLFESAPDAYIVLTPDLTIVSASDAYLRATLAERSAIVGRALFDVFPENPDDPAAAGRRQIHASLDRVRRDRVPDTLALQRYDLRRPAAAGGGYEERYWSLASWPVFGPGHELQYIIHRVENVTEYVKLKQMQSGEADITAAWQMPTTQMEAEIYGREQEAHARLAAEAQRERLYNMFMQAPAGVAVLRGADLVFELANPLYRQLVGVDRALLGKPLLEAVPETEPEVLALLWGVYSSGERFVGREFPITLDWDYTGAPYQKFLNFVYEPLRDTYGLVEGILIFVYEVSDQVFARRRLAVLAEASVALTSLLDYHTTLQTVAQVAVPTLADFCFFDMVGPDQSIRRVAWAHSDPAMQAYFEQIGQYAPTEASTEHPVRRVLATGATEFVPEVRQEWLERAALSPQHLEFMRRLRFHAIMIVPVIVREQQIGALTLCLVEPYRHYTAADRELAEELARRTALGIENAQLYAAQQHARAEAEAAVRTRDEFLSVAAHELKTPVTSMRGYAQLLLNQLAKGSTPDTARLQRALNTINQQSLRLARFIDQLLDVSRIAAGRLALEPQPTDVGRLAREVAASIQLMAAQHALTVSVNGDTHATADPLRLEQVVTNLVTNAVKYSPTGGPVMIAVERIDRDWLRISVTDRGIGIPPEHRAHIFERFYQAHGSGYFGGMGLGLSISQAIVQLHGGHLEAEFPDEGGTRMVVLLPVAPPALT